MSRVKLLEQLANSQANLFLLARNQEYQSKFQSLKGEVKSNLLDEELTKFQGNGSLQFLESYLKLFFFEVFFQDVLKVEICLLLAGLKSKLHDQLLEHHAFHWQVQQLNILHHFPKTIHL